MQTITEAGLFSRTCLMLLLVIGPVTAGLLPRAHAQTVISPTPLIPLRERANPAPVLRTGAEERSDRLLEDPDEKLFHIPLVLNESVESQIEYFTTRGRTIFQNWLNRSARYLPLMKKIFRQYNLPEDLVYIAMIESGFNLHAVSPKKAVGPWQFMKATAREYGLNTDSWVDERKDPIKSTHAAAAHFKNLYNTFGCWALAVASYNAGTGRMQDAVLKTGSSDFWELRTTRFIHLETQEYVPRYMAALIIATDPEAYGFRETQSQPFEYDEIIVNISTDLRRIADYAGSSFKEIADLNPELLQRVTPRTRYVLRIPAGTKKTYQNRVARISLKERKSREERDLARAGGLLFSGIAVKKPVTNPDRATRASIVSPYGAQLSFADPAVEGSRKSRPSQQSKNSAARSFLR